MRRGFTLIELLVACGVFLFGFTAALGLLLIGTRARTQADGMLRLSLSTGSIIEEIRLEAGRERNADGTPAAGIPFAPDKYIGDGFAFVQSPITIDGAAVPESDNTTKAALYPYRPQPGVWYRVIGCVDEKGTNSNLATALRIDLLVVWNPVSDATLSIAALAQRQGLFRTNSPVDMSDSNPNNIQDLADFLAKRGIAVRETACVIRKASWER